jgi:crossover junction endodeoxyribonuclease RusA
LPFPPSVNHAWRPTCKGGKILSDAYRSYRKAVGDCVLEHHIKRHWTTDRLAVGLVCHSPDNRSFDIDNRVKTVLDALVCAGVIVDDKVIDFITIARGAPIPPTGAILVHIEELSSLSGELARLRERLGAGGIVAHHVDRPSH